MTSHRTWTRRDAMAAGLGSLAAAAAGPTALRAFAEARDDARWQIGACDWSIGHRQHIDAMELAADIGLDGVQVSFDDKGEPYDLREEEVRRAYASAEQRLGVKVASLAMGVLNRVPLATHDVAERWVEDVIEVMPKMDQRIVLLAFFGAGDIRGDRDRQDQLIDRLKRLAPRAERAGVVLGLETWLNAEDHRRIVDAVDSPAVRVYYDVANMHTRGYDVPAEIRELGDEYICEFHMKENRGLLGEGDVDFKPIRDAILDIDYRGWLIIEGATERDRTIRDCYVDNARYLRELFDLA